MSFRENLQYLRSRRNMTQEQLAMLLGVSRQSISKWESEKAYPEMDKLLMICDLFGCTLDDLVLGDVRDPGVVTAASGASGARRPISGDAADVSPSRVISLSSAPRMEAAENMPGSPGARQRARVGFNASGAAADFGADATAFDADGNEAGRGASSLPDAGAYGQHGPMPGSAPMGPQLSQDVTGYDAHRRSFAWRIAAGVAVIIVGVAICTLFDDEASILGVTPMNSFLQFLFIALGVVAGLSLIIPAGMEHGEFMRRHPYVENFYTDDDRLHASRQLAVGVVAGIGLILLGVSAAVFGEDMLRPEIDWSATVLLFAVAMGVGLFIYFGILYGLMDLDEYNKETKQERRERSGRDHGGNDDDFYGKLGGGICGIIMLLATIIGLWMLFTGGGYAAWQTGDVMVGRVPFWLPWPIGGVLCGIVNLIISILRANDERRNTRR